MASALVAAATLAACGGDDGGSVAGASALAQANRRGRRIGSRQAVARVTHFAVGRAVRQPGQRRPLPARDHERKVQPSLSGGTIEENAWVDTPVDSDGDGTRDRIHVRIVRPTETANGARTPSSCSRPYYAGLADSPDHNVDVELDGTPHPAATAAAATGASARIMAAAPQVRMLQQVEAAAAGRSWIEGYFIPRGFTIVYADSLGTAGSDGCPTILTRDESVAMASVIRWLGRDATAKDANGKTVVANWSTGHVGMYGVSYDGTLPKMVASLRTRGSTRSCRSPG